MGQPAQRPAAAEALSFRLDRVEAFSLGVPITTPVVTSFGRMTERPALLIRVTGADGAHGWGEAWCNFPAVGARHRALLVETILGPLAVGRNYGCPEDAFADLTRRTEVIAIQSGEPGPLAQIIGGLDCAIWDMLARRVAQPLFRFLGRESDARVAVYASGVNPDGCEATVLEQKSRGHIRFKLKTGFGRDTDIGNLASLRRALGPDASLMLDANQGWDFDTAVEMSRALAEFGPLWLEEPLRADTAIEHWSDFTARTTIPLALGENLRGMAQFEGFLSGSGATYLQPDVGKWGGISGCLPVARMALSQGKVFCPHWLGGAIGLMHSLTLLAAAGGPGLGEVDINPNPLRDALCPDFPHVADGIVTLPDLPGIGVEPDPDMLKRFRVNP